MFLHSACTSVLVVTCLLSAFVSSKSIEQATTKSQDSNEDYFGQIIEKLDGFTILPFVGDIVTPYVGTAKTVLTSVNNVTDGSLKALFNSIMPCNVNGSGIRCEGAVDKESVRDFAKRLLSNIPVRTLPQPMGSLIKLLTDII